MANRLCEELTRLDVCMVERKKTWSFITEAAAELDATRNQQDQLQRGVGRGSKFLRRFVPAFSHTLHERRSATWILRDACDATARTCQV